MINFHNSLENYIHLSKHTHYWNISSRYIPLFLMCFGTLPASTIISPWFFCSLSHNLCTGLPFVLDKWDGQPVFEASKFCSLGLSVKVWGIVKPGPSSTWPGSQSCQQNAAVIKIQMWTLSPSSLAVLFAFQPRRKLQSKEWLGTYGAV